MPRRVTAATGEQDVRQCRGNWTSEVAPGTWPPGGATATLHHTIFVCERWHACKAVHSVRHVRHLHVTSGHTLVTRWHAGITSPPRRHHLASAGGAPPSAAGHQLAV